MALTSSQESDTDRSYLSGEITVTDERVSNPKRQSDGLWPLLRC